MPKKPTPKRKRERKERPPFVGVYIKLMAQPATSRRKRKRKALDKVGAARVAAFNERERAKSAQRRRANIEAREFRHETIERNRESRTTPLVRPVFEGQA